MEVQEPEFDLQDMVRQLVKKWKIIILIGLICAILCSLLSLYQSSKEISATCNFMENSNLEYPYNNYTVAQLAKNCSSSGIANVMSTMEQYCSYREQTAQLEKEKVNLLTTVDSENLTGEQMEYLKNIETILSDSRTRITNLESKLSTDENALYQKLITVHDDAENLTKDAFDATYGNTPQKTINLKLMLVGFLVGGILYCIIFCVRYALSSKLHTADEIQATFQIDNLYDLDNLQSVIHKNDYTDILVLGAGKEKLSIPSVDIASAKHAILAEIIDVTDINQVRHDLTICKQHKISVLGYIILDK